MKVKINFIIYSYFNFIEASYYIPFQTKDIETQTEHVIKSKIKQLINKKYHLNSNHSYLPQKICQLKWGK